MRVRQLLLCGAALSMMLAACGGDDAGLKGDPYEGLYLASGETHNDDGCLAEGAPVPSSQSYFRLDIDSFFGQRYLGWFGCVDAMTCDEDANLFLSFLGQESGVWTTSYKSGLQWNADGTCRFTEAIRTLTGDPEGEIVIEERLSGTTASGIAQADCDDVDDLEGLVEEYRDQMVCRSFEVLRADRVPE